MLWTIGPACHYLHRYNDCAIALNSTYKQRATQNLTRFQDMMLAKVIGSFDPSSFDNQPGVHRFNIISPYLICPETAALVRYGNEGDGGKMLCDISKLPSDCVVYSLGSNGDYTFEKSIIKGSHCTVHTFDCTYNGQDIDERHTYHKICVGQGGPMFRSWRNLTADLGHAHVDVLKMDIEGHEASVIAELTSETPLPSQIAIEMHVPATDEVKYFPTTTARTPAHIALMFLHLARLGYGVVAREDNKITARQNFRPAGHIGCCAEFSLYRIT